MTDEARAKARRAAIARTKKKLVADSIERAKLVEKLIKLVREEERDDASR